MKNYLYPLFLATVLTTVACSDDDKVTNFIEEETPADQKEAIAFTVSDLGAVQQGAQTRAGFSAGTQIVARFESFKSTSVGTAPAAGADKRSTRTVLYAQPDSKLGSTDYSDVDYATTSNGNETYVRYWDDAFGRYANISVYAVAVPGKTSPSNGTATPKTSLVELVNYGGDNATTTNTIWKKDGTSTTSNNNISWVVNTTAQTYGESGTIEEEDLCYSNNIQDDKEPGDGDNVLGKDGRYVWNFASDINNYEPAKTGATTHKNGPLRIALMNTSDPTSTGKFDKGHLVFKHALTRITITLQKSTSDFSGNFKFATETNIKLLKMPVSGILNIKDGTWSVPADAVDAADADKRWKNIDKIATISGGSSNAEGTYQAQVLPGYVLKKGDKTNVFEFTIDDNTYYITQDNLFAALTYDANGNGSKDSGDGDMAGYEGTSITMEQGKNYNFTIVVNKAKIENITATLAPWIDVTAAEESMDNSHVEFSFLSPTGTTCTDFLFYRLKQDLGSINTTDNYTANAYSGDYKTEGAATIEQMAEPNNSKYQAKGWYYDDNKTAYHFRTLNKLAADEGGANADNKSENIANTADPAKSYFTMKADATKKDYHWGAPMKTGATLAYDTEKGFENNLHKGVTSTTSDITIQELHMMSNLEIVLKTEANGKVDLSDATVTLTKLSTSATVDMGTGLITPLAPTSPTTWAMANQGTTAPSTYFVDNDKLVTNAFSCSVIPQALTRGTDADDYVGITITTSDANQYYVITKLSEIKATSIKKGESEYIDPNHPKDGEGNYQAITRWYPNHTYKYTFTITKKGIENITCTVADWITVTGADTKIDLES